MIIKKPEDIASREITDEQVFWNRRNFIRGAALAGSVAATSWLYRSLTSPRIAPQQAETIATVAPAQPAGLQPNDQPTPFEDITSYNNFYEFSTDKREVAYRAKDFVSRPWTVEVSGLCRQPKTYDVDEMTRLWTPEERVYRFRCVEGWSMVIPWIGFPLASLLKDVEPLSTARYIAFQTALDAKQMPNLRRGDVLDWPYVEGLRMDEAWHPLTLLSTGLYGKQLLPQNGAPIRLVVPWKYGFKSIKSVVKIRLVDRQPPTTWSEATPEEYSFYSNVNPKVDHPRWSQATERRIGEFGRRDTLMFNGYAEQVASMYAGMDLAKYY